jgi:hypothetical protein
LKKLVKIGTAVLSVGGLIAGLAFSGVIAAGLQRLGYWAYPANFGLGMMLCGLVFVVLLPPSRKGFIATKWGQKFTVNSAKFETGFWAGVRKRGPFALVLMTNILVGPFFAALVIRFLGYNEQKSWLYAFLTTLIASSLWVSVYLGAVGWIRSMLATLL